MKLNEYLQLLNEMTESNPEILDYDVITAIDEEGNGYNEVVYEPSVGFYDGDNFRTGVDDEDEMDMVNFNEDEDIEDSSPKTFVLNAICLN